MSVSQGFASDPRSGLEIANVIASRAPILTRR